MSAVSEPETISWDEARKQLTDWGDNNASESLLRALLSNSIGWYPRRSLSLESAHRNGLFDLTTGALRVSKGDRNPSYLRLNVEDFKRQFSGTDAKTKTIYRTSDYMPAYLSLLHEAIAEFEITDENQPKATTLQDWFENKIVEGKPVSANLATKMATIVRRPDRQTGGAIPRRPKG